MKNFKFTTLLVIMISLIIVSCQDKDSFNQEVLLTESLKTFRKEFPKEFTSINWSSKKIFNLSRTNNKIPDIDFTLIQISNSNSYYVEFKGRGYFVNSSKEKGINLYNVRYPDRYVEIPFKEKTLVSHSNQELIASSIKSNFLIPNVEKGINFYNVKKTRPNEYYATLNDSIIYDSIPIPMGDPSYGGATVNRWRYALCIGGCTAVAVAIALSDGPAPIMVF